jgi:competence protein ComEC
MPPVGATMASTGRDQTAVGDRAWITDRARKGFRFAPLGPVPSASAWLGTVWLRLTASFEREIEGRRGFLWLPVIFGVGILGYFALPNEPSLSAVGVLAALLGLAAWKARFRAATFRALVVAACAASGLLSAKIQTDWVAAPVISREATVSVSGWIAAREESPANGARLHLLVKSMTASSRGPSPRVARVTVRSKADSLAVGDAISLKARLQPPSGAVMPGGYDFARVAYYDGVGAVGFAYGAAKPAPELGPAPIAIRLTEPLERLRDTIRRRIEAALAGDNGHIAAALVIGDQGGIAESTQNAMRASGLAHMLSISGLHMALVAGSAFWMIRALLALSSGLALNRPIKKWAAASALVVATVYLGIAGAGVATVRSYVMLTIMLAAIMLDRLAITLRNVALAALVVLILNPESLTGPSFHMSFAATVALVAVYEAISARRAGRAVLIDRHAIGPAAYLLRQAAGLLLTSTIAGLATAPYAAYHFQRVAPLTLLANFAAMPVVGAAVMPMAFLAVVVMPFGLEALPLTVMGWGLDWVTLVARTTAAWTAGHGTMSAMPALSLGLGTAGFLWLALWRERWRFLGLVPMALAVPIALLAAHPDILIDDRGMTVAVRGNDGRYAIIDGKGEDFVVENWLRADGDGREPGDATLTATVACDALGCVAPFGAGAHELAVARSAAAVEEDCQLAAVVVSRFGVPIGCSDRAFVIDGEQVAHHGAHALHLSGHDDSGRPAFRVTTAYPGARRPFMPARPTDQ